MIALRLERGSSHSISNYHHTLRSNLRYHLHAPEDHRTGCQAGPTPPSTSSPSPTKWCHVPEKSHRPNWLLAQKKLVVEQPPIHPRQRGQPGRTTYGWPERTFGIRWCEWVRLRGSGSSRARELLQHGSLDRYAQPMSDSPRQACISVAFEFFGNNAYDPAVPTFFSVHFMKTSGIRKLRGRRREFPPSYGFLTALCSVYWRSSRAAEKGRAGDSCWAGRASRLHAAHALPVRCDAVAVYCADPLAGGTLQRPRETASLTQGDSELGM